MASKRRSGDGEGLSAEEIIDVLGGIRPAAAKLSVPVTTVQGWKNRGRIPENRWEAIQSVILELGVEVSASVPAVERVAETHGDRDYGKVASGQRSVPQSGKHADANATKPKSQLKNKKVLPRLDARVIAAFALVFSILATIGIAVILLRPGLLPTGSKHNEELDSSVVAKLSGESDRRFFKAAQSLEAVRTHQEKLGNNLQTLETKVAAFLKKTGAANLARDGAVEGGKEQLSGKVEAFRKQTAEIREGFENFRAKEMNTVFEAIRSLEDASRAAEARLEGFEVSQNALGSQMKAFGKGTVAKFDRDFALLVSLGQLEWMVRSRREFKSAFERVLYFADGRAQLAKILEEFGQKSQRGQESDEALADGFENVKSQLAGGLPPPEGWGVAQGAWAQVKSLIGFRRLGPESQSLVTKVERALMRNDFQTVLHATHGFDGKVYVWRQNVERRFQLEGLLNRLNKKILGMLNQDVPSSSAAAHAGHER